MIAEMLPPAPTLKEVRFDLARDFPTMGGAQSSGEARGKVPSKKTFKDVATISNKGGVGKVVHFAPPKL